MLSPRREFGDQQNATWPFERVFGRAQLKGRRADRTVDELVLVFSFEVSNRM